MKMPGLSQHSKVIKKKKKPAFVAEEEGEEGGELSDELMQEDEFRAPSPLLSEYDKFPEYLEIQLKPHSDLPMLAAWNKYSLNQVIDQKTRELIYLKSFPITLRIYLVPKLNVITVSKHSGELTVDDLLTNLIEG